MNHGVGCTVTMGLTPTNEKMWQNISCAGRSTLVRLPRFRVRRLARQPWKNIVCARESKRPDSEHPHAARLDVLSFENKAGNKHPQAQIKCQV